MIMLQIILSALPRSISSKCMTLSKCGLLERTLYHTRPQLLSSARKISKLSFRYGFSGPFNYHKNGSCNMHRSRNDYAMKNRTSLYYCIGFVLFVGGCTYSSVLLYRLYCQTTGKGGKAEYTDMGEQIAQMKPNKKRLITVAFNADLNSRMMWNFKPQQSSIKVSPGETALAFYTATNPTDEPITGIATYNILPYEAGAYFNKIQCFCFEEQRLNPHEEVDMPVFFYLDPEFAEDPKLEDINNIVLSYTFFEAKPGLQLPFPTFK